MISGEMLIRATECLCGLNLLIQGVEYWQVRSLQRVDGPWCWAIQGQDVPQGWVHRTLDVLFEDRIHALHLVLRLVLALIMLLVGSSLILVGLLWLGQVAWMIRWRGAFNGGSDFMTQVVLTGMLMAHTLMAIGLGPESWAVGLGWIALNATTSYVIAGWVKWLQPAWRNGTALPIFLDSGLHGPLSERSLLRHPKVAKAAAWAFMSWEASFPLAFLGVEWALAECAVALVFHLLVFRFFGLNRFVWAWLASYPAIVWGSVWVNLAP